MARTRSIKPGFFVNCELGELEPIVRLLYIGLWCLADKDGRLKDKPKSIKVQLLPWDDVDVDELLNLLAPEFIQRYEVDGERYIQIGNFAKHQHPHPKEQSQGFPAMPCNYTASREKKLNYVASRAVTISPFPVTISPLLLSGLKEREGGSVELAPPSPAPETNEPVESQKPPKPKSHSHGKYGWVKLTSAEYERLLSDFGEDTVLQYITVVDEKAQMTGNKNKWRDWNLVVRKAIKNAWGEPNNKSPTNAKSIAEKSLEDWVNSDNTEGGLFS